jgi:hypothetical protein
MSLDPATAEAALDMLRVHHDPRTPGRPTHYVPLVARPGHAPFGGCAVRVGSGESSGASFALRAALEPPMFEVDAESLLALSATVVDSISADETTVRPASWANGPGSWAVLVRSAAAAASRRAVVRRCSQGFLVVLHDGAPTDETPEAKRRSEETLARLSGEPEAAPREAPPPVEEPSPFVHPAAPPVPPMQPAQPSYLAVVSPAPSVQRSPLAGTSLALDLPLGPALPFAPEAKSTLEQAASVPAPPNAPRYIRPPAELSGTIDAASLPLPSTAVIPFIAGSNSPTPPGPPRYVKPPRELSGTIDVESLPLPPTAAMPFSAPEAAPSVPELTLEQYAHLRAQLSVRGEDDAETLRQFGVGSRAVKESLQARFAAQFRADPQTQARFVQLVQQRVAELRAR